MSTIKGKKVVKLSGKSLKKNTVLVAQSCLILQLLGLWSVRLPCPWDLPGRNTRVSCHFLLEGNLPDPGTELTSLMSPVLAGGFFTTEPYMIMETPF